MLKAAQSPEPSIDGAILMYDKQTTSIASELRITYACTTMDMYCYRTTESRSGRRLEGACINNSYDISTLKE